MLEAGFVFWGLFLAFALIVVAYWFWMLRKERESSLLPPQPGSRDKAPPTEEAQ